MSQMQKPKKPIEIVETMLSTKKEQEVPKISFPVSGEAQNEFSEIVQQYKAEAEKKRIILFECVPWMQRNQYDDGSGNLNIPHRVYDKTLAYVWAHYAQDIERWYACVPYISQRDVQLYRSLIYFRQELAPEIASDVNKGSCIFLIVADYALEEEIDVLKRGLGLLFPSISPVILRRVISQKDID